MVASLATIRSIAGFQQAGYRKTSFCEVKVEANYHRFWTGIVDRSVDLRVCLKTEVQYVYDIFGYRTNPHHMDIDAYLSIDSEGRLSSREETPHAQNLTEYENQGLCWMVNI